MENILALGAENKTTFSTIYSSGLYMGRPAGDLADLNNFKRFEGDIRDYLKGKNISPHYIVCDLHPDYNSTRLAEAFHDENKDAKLIKVQHHFAHIVACMEDNDIDEEVIGVSFDGTGYGSDGLSWGGEFMVATRKSFTRHYHLRYVAAPGGDAASREGWRMAVAYLMQAYGKDIDTSILERIDASKISVIKQMIEKNINSPLTSSVGRLFDAVSSLIGICDESSFEAEAAILLEKCADKGVTDYYPYDAEGEEIDPSSMIKEIVEDIKKSVSPGKISAKFHNTVGDMIFGVSMRISKSTGIKKVLISGGCFQNRYLTEYVEDKFKSSDLTLVKHKNYPPTDLNVSIGQAVVAFEKYIKEG